MSKQPPQEKKLSTKKPHRDDNTSTNQNAATTSSEDESILDTLAVVVLMCVNFGNALWLVIQFNSRPTHGVFDNILAIPVFGVVWILMTFGCLVLYWSVDAYKRWTDTSPAVAVTGLGIALTLVARGCV